jgi:hypothetical protein
MKEFINLYNKTKSVLQNIEVISNQAEIIRIENFKTLKAIELIKQLVNNSLAETFVLSDLLFELATIDNLDDLSDFLDLTDFEDEDDFDDETD